MEFNHLYHQSVTETSRTDSPLNPQDFVTSFPTASESCPENLLRLLASGMHTSDSYFVLSFRPMNCCLLLYTLGGNGKLKSGNQSYDLPKDSLLLLDCHHAFSIQPSILPWNFKLYFIDWESASVYQSILLPDRAPLICENSSQSPVLHFLNMFSTIPEQYSLSDAFSMHRYLTDLFCILCQKKIPENATPSPGIPFYLTDMKQRLEKYYDRPFRLSDYENYYKVSKYRLCREFSAQFGKPPLQFLNQKRLDTAKEMLLTTDLSIHEISSLVGYESPTHFINLFRKNTGTTPGSFRQIMRNNETNTPK